MCPEHSRPACHSATPSRLSPRHQTAGTPCRQISFLNCCSPAGQTQPSSCQDRAGGQGGVWQTLQASKKAGKQDVCRLMHPCRLVTSHPVRLAGCRLQHSQRGKPYLLSASTCQQVAGRHHVPQACRLAPQPNRVLARLADGRLQHNQEYVCVALQALTRRWLEGTMLQTSSVGCLSN